MIRFLDNLLQLDGRSVYGDMMERAMYNGLFAAQSPDGRSIRYYTPFDGRRDYFSADTYCCPNNYRRIVSELPGMIYYHVSEGLAINLYAPSAVETELKQGVSLRVEQQTEYPRTGLVEITVTPSQPARFSLWLRIPRWCAEARIGVNQQPVDAPVKSGDFFRIERMWNPGDKVRLDMPMPLRFIRGRKAQAGRVALLSGPQVFCLGRSRHEGLAGKDLRSLVIDPETIEGPVADETVRPGGQACRLRAWSPGAWYPTVETDLGLTLTEFADPEGELIYFKVPNPDLAVFETDELLDGGGV